MDSLAEEVAKQYYTAGTTSSVIIRSSRYLTIQASSEYGNFCCTKLSRVVVATVVRMVTC